MMRGRSTLATGKRFQLLLLPCHTTREGGGDLFPDWLPRHINAKEMLALHEVLQQVCVTHPDSLRHHW